MAIDDNFRVCGNCGAGYRLGEDCDRCAKRATNWKYTKGMTLDEELKKREREELMQSLKDELYEEFKQRQENGPRLKLFKVTCHVVTGFVDGPRGYHAYILDVDGPTAEGRVIGALGHSKLSPDHAVDTLEIQGPFKAGHVLLWDEF